MLGELNAIGCALSWSISVIFFKKVEPFINPFRLNHLKNWTALLLFSFTVFILGNSPLDHDPYSVIMLILSGLIGIGIADALLLNSLSKLEATTFAIVETAYAPTIIAIGLIFLGETLSFLHAGATMIIMLAIFITIYESYKLNQKYALAVTRQNLSGLIYGWISYILMGAGIMIMKPFFETIDLFWIITYRLVGGTMGSFCLLKLNNRHNLVSFKPLNYEGSSVADTRSFRINCFVAIFFSSYLGLLMWIAGFKYEKAYLVAVLNQTSTFFTILLAIIFLKESLTKTKLAASILAFTGILILCLTE